MVRVRPSRDQIVDHVNVVALWMLPTHGSGSGSSDIRDHHPVSDHSGLTANYVVIGVAEPIVGCTMSTAAIISSFELFVSGCITADLHSH